MENPYQHPYPSIHVMSVMRTGPDAMKMFVLCDGCAKIKNFDIDFPGYCDWMDGDSVEDAMPALAAVHVAQIATGTCPECQRKLLGG